MKISTRCVSLCLLSCLLLAGCGDPQRAKLVGTWDIATADSLMKRLDGDSEFETGSETEEAPSTPKMQIQFLGNGQLTTLTQMGIVTPKPKQGTWEMMNFDAASNIMKVKCKIGLQETDHAIEFIDDDTIKLLPPNMAGLSLKLQFRRRK